MKTPPDIATGRCRGGLFIGHVLGDLSGLFFHYVFRKREPRRTVLPTIWADVNSSLSVA